MDKKDDSDNENNNEEDTFRIKFKEIDGDKIIISVNPEHSMGDALKKYLNRKEIDESGNINSLIQVVNNIISNAIQAYDGKPGQKIVLDIYPEKNYIIFKIQDFAGGLPDEVKSKLFKEMVTTKGKNGTGLGLFMSYSNIKAHFNGDIKFETKKGKGTTFYIKIPNKN